MSVNEVLGRQEVLQAEMQPGKLGVCWLEMELERMLVCLDEMELAISQENLESSNGPEEGQESANGFDLAVRQIWRPPPMVLWAY